jgi:deoxyribonucleoside regulator
MTTKEDLLIRASELYYQQNLSQNAIAEILGTSRPTVSRLLEEARETGIVEITIHNPVKKNADLSKRLRSEFNLRDAIVISGTYSYDEALQKCGMAASQLLHSVLENNMSIGITWGAPMNHFATVLEPKEYYNVNIVQMVGCLGTGNPRMDGLELAITISKKLNGTYSNIYAPAFVENEFVHKYLLSEPQIQATLKKALTIDIVVTGIGALDDETSTLHATGYISEEERQTLVSKGCVGHMLARMYDIKGKEVPIEDKYVISAPLDCLKTPKWTIGISAHPKKTRSVYAAIISGYVNCLVIDESLAKSLLDFKDQQK